MLPVKHDIADPSVTNICYATQKTQHFVLLLFNALVIAWKQQQNKMLCFLGCIANICDTLCNVTEYLLSHPFPANTKCITAKVFFLYFTHCLIIVVFYGMIRTSAFSKPWFILTLHKCTLKTLKVFTSCVSLVILRIIMMNNETIKPSHVLAPCKLTHILLPTLFFSFRS